MSDNVNITPGSGAIIAADDIGGVMYQRFKLDIGGDGASIPLIGDATYGIPADVKRVAGDVSTKPKSGEMWPVVAAAVLPVSDNGVSLTVDAPVGAPVFVRLSDGTDPISGLAVSGAVTGHQGTAAVTAGAWPMKITDGTNLAGLSTVGSDHALKVDVIQSVEGAGSSADLETLGNVTPAAGLYDDSATDPTAGQAGAIRITAKRGLHANLRNAAGVEIGSAASPVYIAAATVPGTFPVSGLVTVNLKDAANAAYSTANPVPVAITGKARTRVTKHTALIASQTAQDLWTPGASKKFYITKLVLAVTVAGTLVVYDATDAAGNEMFRGTQAVGNREYNFGADPWPASAINNVLRWTSGTGLVGEMTVHGYEEA